MNALSWLALAALVALFYGPVQHLLESIARHHLFVMRDELFDKARRGETSFDSDEYQEARRQLNSLIRFTHLTKWQHVLFIVKFLRFKEPDHSMSPLYRPLRERVALVMALLLVMRSPFVLLVSFCVGLYQFITLNALKTKRRALSLLHVIERESRSV